jgi:hypothetical protein
VHVDRRRISVNSHHVVGQVAVDGCAGLQIGYGGLRSAQ